jgi:hypothetical protein
MMRQPQLLDCATQLSLTPGLGTASPIPLLIHDNAKLRDGDVSVAFKASGTASRST